MCDHVDVWPWNGYPRSRSATEFPWRPVFGSRVKLPLNENTPWESCGLISDDCSQLKLMPNFTVCLSWIQVKSEINWRFCEPIRFGVVEPIPTLEYPEMENCAIPGIPVATPFSPSCAL